ncbi:MAG TPA: hypothetical protein DCF68_22450 [Cyanothece sp. UBA12306]|nr:hypothetical protein [Cyanothece sp. UBA12306]
MSSSKGESPSEPQVNQQIPQEKAVEDQANVLAAPVGLVSIVIVCCGQLEFTRLCVPSLLYHSRRPYELIFVDFGSLDGTSEYLAGVAAAAPVRVVIERSNPDRSLASACKEAIMKSWGEFIVLLNNDTIVTNDWLDQLLALANSSAEVGVVGPMSNYASPPQRVDEVTYRLRTKTVVQNPNTVEDGSLHTMIETVDRFARQWREQNRGKWFEAQRLDEFCLLIKREVLLKTNLFDGNSSLSIFAPNAFAIKVRKAGYHLAGCVDLFIHHFGTRTVAKADN